MNTKSSVQGKSSQTDEQLRQTSSSPSPCEEPQGRSGHLRYLIGIVTCAAVLVLGLGEHYATVVPLEKELLSREVRCIAQEIDATVKFRSAVISLAAGTVEVDALLANGRLDKFLDRLRGQLPDFLSLEIISDRGEVVAMIGDLPLSQAGIPGQARANRFVRVSSDIKPNEGVFVDDPANGCFSVTCRHIGPEKGQWFSRSRFSRESIEQLLSSFPNRKAALVQVTGGPKAARSSHDWNVAATSGRWWQGADKAEALLASPGWIVRVENASSVSVFRSLPVLIPAILLCVVAIAFVARLFSNSWSVTRHHQDDTAAQPCVHDEGMTALQNGIEEASASPDLAAAQESEKVVSEPEPENSTEGKELSAEVHEPTASEADSLQCAFPCCAVVVPDSPQYPDTSTPPDEYPEVGRPLPDEIELPEDHFVVSSLLSEVSVASEPESPDFGIEPELTLDEAAALCGDTEIIVGEPMSIELEFPENYVGSDPSIPPEPRRAGYYSAVILGPPESAKDRGTSREALRKANDEDFPETIEISWTEPAEATRCGAQLKPDHGKPTHEEDHAEADKWHGHYTS